LIALIYGTAFFTKLNLILGSKLGQ